MINKFVLLMLLVLSFITFNCTNEKKVATDLLEKEENSDSLGISKYVYTKFLITKDTFNALEEIVIKSTLSDISFLDNAKSLGHIGIVEAAFNNLSKESIEVISDKYEIKTDTVIYNIVTKFKSDTTQSSQLVFEIRLKVDIDERNYYGKVDTIFPSRGEIFIERSSRR